jgi:hypothetical protein
MKKIPRKFSEGSLLLKMTWQKALIKSKQETWLARGLMTYENENACFDKNLHRFFFLYLGASQ